MQSVLSRICSYVEKHLNKERLKWSPKMKLSWMIGKYRHFTLYPIIFRRDGRTSSVIVLNIHFFGFQLSWQSSCWQISAPVADTMAPTKTSQIFLLISLQNVQLLTSVTILFLSSELMPLIMWHNALFLIFHTTTYQYFKTTHSELYINCFILTWTTTTFLWLEMRHSMDWVICWR